MKKILAILMVILIASIFSAVFAEETKVQAETGTKLTFQNEKIFKYLAAALSIGCATISSGIAIGRIGSAAMGAISERPEAAGSAIILAALAEGICLWGFLIAFFILQL